MHLHRKMDRTALISKFSILYIWCGRVGGWVLINTTRKFILCKMFVYKILFVNLVVTNFANVCACRIANWWSFTGPDSKKFLEILLSINRRRRIIFWTICLKINQTWIWIRYVIMLNSNVFCLSQKFNLSLYFQADNLSQYVNRNMEWCCWNLFLAI